MTGWAWTCDACLVFHRDEVRAMGGRAATCAVCGERVESRNALSAEQAQRAQFRRSLVVSGMAVCLKCGELYSRNDAACPKCGAGGPVDQAAADRGFAPLAKVIDLALERAKRGKAG